jgi:hypothetical protein
MSEVKVEGKEPRAGRSSMIRKQWCLSSLSTYAADARARSLLRRPSECYQAIRWYIDRPNI